MPGAPHGVSHQPAAFFTRPAQQSLVDDADPRRGTHALRHVHSWFVTEAPQKGALEQHSDAALQVDPLALHEGGARHTPPASSVVPAQQSEGLFARMPSPAQVALHVGVPVADEARQNRADEQHGVALERHDVPLERHIGGARHTPFASMVRPEQQSACVAAFAPSGAQLAVQVVADVAEVPRQNGTDAQHWRADEQLCPAAVHVGDDWQTPFVHARPLQHCVPPPQVWPAVRQTSGSRHTPDVHVSPLQHVLEAEHAWFARRQVLVG